MKIFVCISILFYVILSTENNENPQNFNQSGKQIENLISKDEQQQEDQEENVNMHNLSNDSPPKLTRKSASFKSNLKNIKKPEPQTNKQQEILNVSEKIKSKGGTKPVEKITNKPNRFFYNPQNSIYTNKKQENDDELKHLHQDKAKFPNFTTFTKFKNQMSNRSTNENARTFFGLNAESKITNSYNPFSPNYPFDTAQYHLSTNESLMKPKFDVTSTNQNESKIPNNYNPIFTNSPFDTPKYHHSASDGSIASANESIQKPKYEKKMKNPLTRLYDPNTIQEEVTIKYKENENFFNSTENLDSWYQTPFTDEHSSNMISQNHSQSSFEGSPKSKSNLNPLSAHNMNIGNGLSMTMPTFHHLQNVNVGESHGFSMTMPIFHHPPQNANNNHNVNFDDMANGYQIKTFQFDDSDLEDWFSFDLKRAKSEPLPKRLKTEEEKRIQEKKRMLCRKNTSETKTKREELPQLKNDLKEDFKNGALKFGGKEDNIIRAKSNLKFVYADEIKKIEEEAKKDCILNAPLPQYTNPHNSQTISQRMKILFEDAKRTQEKIDPYLVADYIDFINLVQKIHAEVENISPENILASEKLTAYFIWALRLKVSQYNHFNPKKFEL